jgi:alkylated DNA repair dioxygenase AlkB
MSDIKTTINNQQHEPSSVNGSPATVSTNTTTAINPQRPDNRASIVNGAMEVASVGPSVPIVPIGMRYEEDVIDGKMESRLKQFLYGPMMRPRKWSEGPGGRPRRRVQQFGFSYLYGTHSLSKADPIPVELKEVINHLHQKGLVGTMGEVNQIIVNEYIPGQGITPHTDDVRIFGDQIASLTLGSGVTMIFTDPANGDNFEQYLKPRSIVVLSDEARWRWRHSIPARKSDNIINELGKPTTVQRGTRVSITFRHVPPNVTTNLS